MAGGWASDGAVNEQVEATLEDALAIARHRLPKGESALYCVECGDVIPERRRLALPGVKYCLACQILNEKAQNQRALYNRRANKDSQLK